MGPLQLGWVHPENGPNSRYGLAGARDVLGAELGSALTTSLRSKVRFSVLLREMQVHTFITRTRYMPQPHWLLPAVLWPQGALHCFPIAHMSGGSSSDWWDGWEWRGEWIDSSSSDPTPTVQATDEQGINAVHTLRDRLQQMLAMTQRRSHKTGTERATSISKGNAAYAAMEAVIMAREWQVEAKRVYHQKFAEAAEAEETYHDAIKRTVEKTEVLEKHVKTVTMRADSLVTTEADFFQTLIERQEETIRELNTLCGQLCLPRSTS